MSFTFDLSRVLQPPLAEHVKEIGESLTDGTPLKRRFNITPPWEAVPLALNYLLTGGTRNEMANLAQSVRAADKVSRTLIYLAGVLVISYLLAVGHFFTYTINFGKDLYALLVLFVWWFTMLLLLFAQLNGRLRALPATVTAEEVRKRPEFHLPALFFNYQAFGFERGEGYAAAFIVLFGLIGTTAGWAALLYEAAARMLSFDPYKTGFAMLWCAFLLQHILTALSLSVSYSEYLAATRKEGEPLAPLEKLRVDFVNVYIFTVTTVLTPLGFSFVVYALS